MLDVANYLKQLREVPPKPPNPPNGPIDGTAGKPEDNGPMEARVATLEAIIPTLMTKADGESIKAEIHKNTIDIQRWMIATVIGLFLGFGGLFLAMSTALKPAPASASSQSPIIITIPQPITPVAVPPSK